MHEANENSVDEIFMMPVEKRSVSEIPIASKRLLHDHSSDSNPATPKPDPNTLNLRQIDELSESESVSSAGEEISTKNSRYIHKKSGHEPTKDE